MINKEQLITNGYNLFSSFKKPDLYIVNSDDFEGKEFNEILKDVDLNSFSGLHVGHTGWSPIESMSKDAINYLMPKFVELALNLETNDEEDLFISQFLWMLTPSEDSGRFDEYDATHIRFILEVLSYTKNELKDVIEQECIEDDLAAAIEFWNTVLNKK